MQTRAPHADAMLLAVALICSLTPHHSWHRILDFRVLHSLGPEVLLTCQAFLVWRKRKKETRDLARGRERGGGWMDRKIQGM